jgi:hypothetical protein
MGVDAGAFVPLHYEPQGTALAQVPREEYRVDETLGEYSASSGASDNFLAIVLGRIERTYGLPGFAAAFTADFESFLQTVDTDSATAGLQPYLTPSGTPVLTLAATRWYGPAQTWPREVVNYPYIEFWHRLDASLVQAGIATLGPELLGDAAWRQLFPTEGSLQENPGLRLTLSRSSMAVRPLSVDQLGRTRAATGTGDIGAIERP